MIKINSFVFFDLETTGFPWQENNDTKITELSMVAVSRDSILNTEPKSIPRVIHKLSMCFQPRRHINHHVTRVTGLSNNQLQHESSFDKATVEMISNFLSRLKPPVCIVSHNGFYFDYPILQGHIFNANMTLSEDIFCIDSLFMFKSIFKARATIKESSENVEIVIQDNDEFSQFELNEDDLLAIEAMESLAASPEYKFTNVLKINSAENTPEKRKLDIILSGDSPSPSKVKRKLFPPKKRQSYKLKDIYEKLLGFEPSDIHRAESDCIILLECCIAVGQEFVKWCESNYVLFCDMPRMEAGKKFPRFKFTSR